MKTRKIYVPIKQALENSEDLQNPLIPSGFIKTFPNNFGINLCSVKGFDVELTEDNQYKSITVDFLPTPQKSDKEHYYVVEDLDGNEVYIFKSHFALRNEDVNQILNKDIVDEYDQIEYVIMGEFEEKDIKIF